MAKVILSSTIPEFDGVLYDTIEIVDFDTIENVRLLMKYLENKINKFSCSNQCKIYLKTTKAVNNTLDYSIVPGDDMDISIENKELSDSSDSSIDFEPPKSYAPKIKAKGKALNTCKSFNSKNLNTRKSFNSNNLNKNVKRKLSFSSPNEIGTLNLLQSLNLGNELRNSSSSSRVSLSTDKAVVIDKPTPVIGSADTSKQNQRYSDVKIATNAQGQKCCGRLKSRKGPKKYCTNVIYKKGMCKQHHSKWKIDNPYS